jgi:hypothetical protein
MIGQKVYLPDMKAYKLKKKQLWSRKEDYGVEAA